MGARHLVLAVVLAVLASCTPTLKDDTYACTDDASCPTGFQCVAGFCRNVPGGQCQRDYECEDRNPCTDDGCENEYCEHLPVDGLPCPDDGVFCNGPEGCVGGACVNLGTPPCAACSEDLGCPCGSLGDPCCFDFCMDPQTMCDGGTCMPCGGDGQLCCVSREQACNPGLVCPWDATGAIPRCAPCGADAEPCCIEGCDEGSWCDVAEADATGTYPLCSALECGCPPGQLCVDPVPGPDMTLVCLECGEENYPCCAGGTCNRGELFCYVGWCIGPKTGM